MKEQLFKDVFDEQLAEDAIINDRHTGHKQDYLIIHCLLKIYKPKVFCELGTNTGFGAKIIKNALGKDADVFTIDLPPEKAAVSKQHPITEGKGDTVGDECNLDHTQILADTRTFDYTKYNFDGFFVDTDHTYDNVYAETKNILLCEPKIIIWHDSDVPEVYEAIVDAMSSQPYDLYRVTDTRILYAIENKND